MERREFSEASQALQMAFLTGRALLALEAYGPRKAATHDRQSFERLKGALERFRNIIDEPMLILFSDEDEAFLGEASAGISVLKTGLSPDQRRSLAESIDALSRTIGLVIDAEAAAATDIGMLKTFLRGISVPALDRVAQLTDERDATATPSVALG